MSNKHKNASEIVIPAMFTAVIAACAQITIPLPSGVPITLQTLAVALCGYCLGVKKSVLSVLVYILLGLIGAPVFSGFSAGTAVLFGRTGGFIIGFMFLVFACGTAGDYEKSTVRACVGLPGLIACHFVGILWYSYLTGTDFRTAALLVSVPFLLKDILCVVGAALFSKRIERLLPFSGRKK